MAGETGTEPTKARVGRPTKEEAERRRKAVEDAKIAAGDSNGATGSTDNPAPAPESNQGQTQSNVGGDYSTDELEKIEENATYGAAEKPAETHETFRDSMIQDVDFEEVREVKDSVVDQNNNHNAFEEDIIENESDGNKSTAGDVGSSESSGSSDTDSTVTDKGTGDAGKSESVNPDLDDLSPTEKRKQVELFAETILTTYAQLLPVIFKGMASYNQGKLEVMDRDGIIRLSMVVGKDPVDGDLTILQHVTEHNQQVEEVFVVDDAMKLAIKEPLIAVLMEKGIAPTPMTSLLIAVGSQVLQFSVAAYQFMGQKKEAISQFAEFRKQELDQEKELHRQKQHSAAPTNYQQKPSAPEATTGTTGATGSGEKQPIANEIKIEEIITPEAIKNNSGVTGTTGATGSASQPDNGNEITVEEVTDEELK